MEKKEETDKKPDEEEDIEEDKGELGFGFGNFWIGACIFQGIVMLFYAFIGLDENLFDPAYGILILALPPSIVGISKEVPKAASAIDIGHSKNRFSFDLLNKS